MPVEGLDDSITLFPDLLFESWFKVNSLMKIQLIEWSDRVQSGMDMRSVLPPCLSTGQASMLDQYFAPSLQLDQN